jgi:hemoglobin
MDENEKAISTCVREFYAAARRDSVLGPLFEATIQDWDEHLRIIENFWSNALLGTGRYKGFPFPAHMNLPVELAHFERWLELFERSAQATLPADLASKAMAKAQHMSTSFKAGIFPFTDAQGRPSRLPG